MKQKPKEVKKRTPYKPIQYIEYIDRFWGDFHDTDKMNEKLDNLGNVVMCMWCYFLSKYDEETLTQFINQEINTTEEQTQ